MPPPLETDSNGNVIMRPVTTLATRLVAASAVLLIIGYAETPEDLEAGVSQTAQFVLSPQQCLYLADTLTTAAIKVFESSPGEQYQ